MTREFSHVDFRRVFNVRLRMCVRTNVQRAISLRIQQLRNLDARLCRAINVIPFAIRSVISRDVTVQ